MGWSGGSGGSAEVTRDVTVTSTAEETEEMLFYHDSSMTVLAGNSRSALVERVAK